MATKERLVIEKLFKIANKEGEDVPFVLNEVQADLDATLTGRDVIPKQRQKGVSSYFLARYAVICMYRRNTRAVVISHETEATQRMLAKVRYYLSNMNGPPPIFGNANKNELTFPKTDSMFYIGTAGAKKFGRGDTISHLHCSEVAFWEDAKKLMTGLLQAVPKSGEVALESTGNGQGNYYHRQCMQAKNGIGRYRMHFYGWLGDPEYRYDLTPEEEEKILDTLDEDFDEKTLLKLEGVTPGHIAWRRDKLSELDWDLGQFKQEYPISLEECFQASGSSLFSKIHFISTKTWDRIDRYTYALSGHPTEGRHYAIGGDVGGGVRKDRTVAEIVCLDTDEQVAEWKSDSVDPAEFGEIVLPNLGKRYNGAFISVEKNNHGIVTLDQLRRNYSTSLIYKSAFRKERGEVLNALSAYGVGTTARSKPYLVGALRRYLTESLVVYSDTLLDELKSFVEKENGKLEGEDGCFDDHVMAMAILVHGIPKAKMALLPSVVVPPPPKPSEFSLDAIIDELHNRGFNFPFRDQTLVDVQ